MRSFVDSTLTFPKSLPLESSRALYLYTDDFYLVALQRCYHSNSYTPLANLYRNRRLPAEMALHLSLLICTALCLLLSMLVHSQNDFVKNCLAFMPEVYISNSARQVLEYVQSRTTLMFPDNDRTCARPSQVVSADLCRVALLIATSNRSGITFEMWLPADWSSRILGTGSGGYRRRSVEFPCCRA